MKRIVGPLLFVLALLVFIIALPTGAEEKQALAGLELLQPGVYYKAPGGWTRLEPITSSGGGLKHIGKLFIPLAGAVLTPQVVQSFRGAEAPVQIEERRPTFYVKQVPLPVTMASLPGQSPRDWMIVRFDKKKDRRELQVSNGGSIFTFKAGLSKDRLPDIVVTRISESVFSITPAANLPPGEYLLTGGMGMSGSDFGVKVEVTRTGQ